jgi:ornithine carbamoyltransferase
MTTATTLRSRHLLGIEDLEPGEIDLILDTALAMKEVGTRPIKKVPTLRGRTVVNPVLRIQHAHAHVVRAGREAASARTRLA